MQTRRHMMYYPSQGRAVNRYKHKHGIVGIDIHKPTRDRFKKRCEELDLTYDEFLNSLLDTEKTSKVCEPFKRR